MKSPAVLNQYPWIETRGSNLTRRAAFNADRGVGVSPHSMFKAPTTLYSVRDLTFLKQRERPQWARFL